MKKYKIYFAGSIRGGREDVELYLQIIEHIKNYGEVLTEHVGKKDLKVLGEDNVDDSYIYNRDLTWLLSSDIIIAEVSTPSLGVGFEIATALHNNKKVLCLYRPQTGKRLSAIITGCPHIINREYETIDDAFKVIDNYFKDLAA